MSKSKAKLTTQVRIKPDTRPLLNALKRVRRLSFADAIDLSIHSFAASEGVQVQACDRKKEAGQKLVSA